MRNKSLDAVKAIAACLVVCIHVSFPGQAGQLVKVLARCAVPFFFMVSGYFCYYQNCNASKRILSKILHIMKLFAVSVVFVKASIDERVKRIKRLYELNDSKLRGMRQGDRF